MSYISNVAAVFYTQQKEQVSVVKLWVQENFPFDAWEKAGVSTKVRWFEYGMFFEVNDVKWYDGIPEVAAFKECANEFIELFCDYDKVMGESVGAYEFMRVGEDMEDMEHDREGSYDFLLDISRKIEINTNL